MLLYFLLMWKYVTIQYNTISFRMSLWMPFEMWIIKKKILYRIRKEIDKLSCKFLKIWRAISVRQSVFVCNPIFLLGWAKNLMLNYRGLMILSAKCMKTTKKTHKKNTFFGPTKKCIFSRPGQSMGLLLLLYFIKYQSWSI